MQPATQIDLQALVQELAPACGFDLASIARIEDFPELRHFEDWVAQDRAGEMHYLTARNDAGELKRSAVRHSAPWARSAIVCAVNFNSVAPFSIDDHPLDAGWISRYAWFENPEGDRNTDYHDAVLYRLRQLEAQVLARAGEIRTWSYVDTGPIVERVLAKYAGLGWIAKNTCVINETIGSFIFLGVILTSIELPGAHVNITAPDRCGSCTRCIDACPTEAITAPYELDPRRCISYLTIEKRGALPVEFHSGIGRQIFGCDICQDVCPWNGAITGVRPPVTTLPEFSARREFINPDLNKLARLTPDEFAAMFRRSPIKRTKYEGFMRNVAMALGNSGSAAARVSLEHLAQNHNAEISAAARQSLARIKQI